jgi:hypothetical protein
MSSRPSGRILDYVRGDRENHPGCGAIFTRGGGRMIGGSRKMVGAAGTVGWRELAAVTAALLMLSVAFTWPLARHFTTDVPYTHRAAPGYERVPMAQGDHLQLLYFFWLFGDSVREGRVPLTDHYEFRDGGPPVFFFQPSLLPLLTFLLSPLGLIASYNLLTLLSFVGAGLATHLLLRLDLADRWAAFAGSLVVALFPYRVAQLAGHANGFLAFLVPLFLFFFERSLRGSRWCGWAVAAGVTFFFAGAMEFHIVYYLTILLGRYLPFRFLAPLSDWLAAREPTPAPQPDTVSRALAACGGAGAGIAVCHVAASVHPVGRFGWPVTALAGAGLALLLWRACSRTAIRYLDPPAAGWHRACALALSPFALLALAPLLRGLAIPQSGRALAAAVLAASAALALVPLRQLPHARLLPQARDLLRERSRRYLAHLGFIGATLGYLLLVRRFVFAPSVAGAGRRFSDVIANSPHPADLITHSNANAERAVYVGFVAAALALAGLAAARRVDDPGRRARIAFFAIVGLAGLLLAVGPNLDLLPIYHLLFRVVPMFNFPRVSGRILTIGAVGLAMLAALGLAAVRSRAGRRAGIATAAILALLVADYLPAGAPGLTTLPLSHPVYERLAGERTDGETILELPIWPGDSAWTSNYLWYVTRYRNLLLNGYSPATPRNYVERVFTPLYPLDFGEMRRPQYDLLKRLGIRFIVFHEEVYPRKISEFPARLAVKNLRGSNYLETVVGAPPLWLFRLRPEPPADGEFVAGGISPLGSLWEIEQQNFAGVVRVDDPLASGGSVASFPAGAPGPLGQPLPGRVYPSGSYRVQARFLAERPGGAPVISLRVRVGKPGSVAAESTVRPGSDRGGILDLETRFTLAAPEQVFVEGATDGSAAVRWDYLLLSFAEAPEPQLGVEIEDLWNMGIPFADPAASGGEAVEFPPGFRDFAVSGPDRVLPAGAWVARLRVGDEPPGSPAGPERFVVGLSNVESPLAGVALPALPGTGGYREIELPFSLARSAPVRFRVLNSGQRRLVLDRVTIAPR